jgi:hypothetical protein
MVGGKRQHRAAHLAEVGYTKSQSGLIPAFGQSSKGNCAEQCDHGDTREQVAAGEPVSPFSLSN